ncbi:TRAP transporter small permease [Pseudohoeflea suaedae]|uniref:TRAP transporter small permease protein n=1 Tax=Pseudohoeflea suaedae TaxID=877384 RepID=A0A4R5PI52_9HYPH|nr:TRAP transporter small permease [Pseudohoeflea suaedae]TDH34905.1 TRAP transporter small permease [Pseudohoeflea suaedae]
MKAFLSACSIVDRFVFRLNVFVVAAILAAMSGIVFYGVIGRYVFNAPLFWGEETARFLMFFLVLTGSALGLRLSQHPRLTMFVDLFPERHRKALMLLGDAIVFGTILVILIQGTELAIDEGIMRTPALRISYFWIYLAYPIGAVLGLMQLIGAYFAPQLADTLNEDAEETAL